jgi:hypothetical protein
MGALPPGQGQPTEYSGGPRRPPEADASPFLGRVLDRAGVERQPVSGTQAGPLRALEDVSDAEPGDRHPSGRHPPDRDDTMRPIEEHDVDRKAHPEGVNGPASLQEHAMTPVERRGPDEATDPLASRLGRVDDPSNATGVDEDNPSHMMMLRVGEDT